ncbi:hypothetical protein SAMD00023353_0702290 [Rosellinia necatrix]|uniref:Uncharacterized protein n=1 Tax=Rosellinia necatrix TaxID=77044 RepID=A0A1S8A5X0_ROSNE|nr:hypothetical protein SAMD00023353_0702290 [Rosellinia necatrix]
MLKKGVKHTIVVTDPGRRLTMAILVVNEIPTNSDIWLMQMGIQRGLIAYF